MKRFWYKAYGMISKKRWMGRQLREIYHIYEIIRPADEITMKCSGVKLYLKTMLLSVLVFLLGLSFLGASLYHFIMLFTLVYLFRREILRRSVGKEELKLLKQLEKYLNDLRHAYNRLNIVEEAIYETLEQADYEISLHMGRIHDILTMGDEGDVLQYKETSPNKFLTVFLALCRITVQYGDSKKDEISLFLSNLSQLRNEINVEILKREKINHVFSGLVFISMFPVFFLKAIEEWGISGLPELENYYKGAYGIIMSLLIFLITLLSYGLISRLRGNSDLYRPRHRWLEWICERGAIKSYLQHYLYRRAGRAYRLNRLIRRTGEPITLPQFLIMRTLTAAGTLAGVLFVLGHAVLLSQWNAIHEVREISGIEMISSSQERSACADLVEELADRYKKEKELRNKKEGLMEEAGGNERLLRKIDIAPLAEEIIKRVENYQNIGFRWYYLLIAAAAAALASYCPLLVLEVRGYFMKTEMEDEVMQFHSIIIMLMYIERMDVLTILEWMENFSFIFRESIMECADLFCYDEEGALEELKEQEPFPPFVRIVENLEACDRVGIGRAFEEMSGQRAYYSKKRKQENEISISNRGVIGQVAAYIPLTLTVGGYLIVPFVLESVNQLMAYVSQMQLG